MIGVVFWNDTHSKKAVIWCDDESTFAFANEKDSRGLHSLDVGDIVEFDLALAGELRVARDIRVKPSMAHCETAASDNGTVLAFASRRDDASRAITKKPKADIVNLHNEPCFA